MKIQLWNVSRPPTWILLIAASLLASQACAKRHPGPFDGVGGAPASPTQSPGPLSLDACLELGMAHQPALDAARASLAAAQAGSQSVARIPPFLSPDLRIRREQACQGITIAQAALTQAEWDTRYAITRNFFTVQYIRAQDKVVTEVLQNLDKGYARAKKLYETGDVDVKITKNDLDVIQIQIVTVKGKKAQIDNGMLKALAALREAMGLRYDYPLEIAAVALPAAVYEVKKMVDKTIEEKDKKGIVTKKLVKEEVIEYFPLMKLNKSDLIASAIVNRGEIMQANSANRVTELEVQAQRSHLFGMKVGTFAQASDIHVTPIPQGIMNGEYRPGAFAIEYPSMLVGFRRDRLTRAQALNDRAVAVVDKANNLVSLDVEAQYLKWQEAAEDVANLSGIQKIARDLPQKVQDLQPKDFTGSSVIQANITAVMVRTELNDAMHLHALALAGLERATAGAFRVYPTAAPPKK